MFKGDGQMRCMDDPPCDGHSLDHVRDFVPGGCTRTYCPGTDVHHASGIYNKVRGKREGGRAFHSSSYN